MSLHVSGGRVVLFLLSLLFDAVSSHEARSRVVDARMRSLVVSGRDAGPLIQ